MGDLVSLSRHRKARARAEARATADANAARLDAHRREDAPEG